MGRNNTTSKNIVNSLYIYMFRPVIGHYQVDVQDTWKRKLYQDFCKGFSDLILLSCRIVALVSTQPLTEMSTRNPSWG
jgi:hypothetical protein